MDLKSPKLWLTRLWRVLVSPVTTTLLVLVLTTLMIVEASGSSYQSPISIPNRMIPAAARIILLGLWANLLAIFLESFPSHQAKPSILPILKRGVFILGALILTTGVVAGLDDAGQGRMTLRPNQVSQSLLFGLPGEEVELFLGYDFELETDKELGLNLRPSATQSSQSFELAQGRRLLLPNGTALYLESLQFDSLKMRATIVHDDKVISIGAGDSLEHKGTRLQLVQIEMNHAAQGIPALRFSVPATEEELWLPEGTGECPGLLCGVDFTGVEAELSVTLRSATQQHPLWPTISLILLLIGLVVQGYSHKPAQQGGHS